MMTTKNFQKRIDRALEDLLLNRLERKKLTLIILMMPLNSLMKNFLSMRRIMRPCHMLMMKKMK